MGAREEAETAAQTALNHLRAMAGHCACFCVSVAMSNQSLKETGEEAGGAMGKKKLMSICFLLFKLESLSCFESIILISN